MSKPNEITQNNKSLLNLLIEHGPEKLSNSLGDMDELFWLFLDSEYADDGDLRRKLMVSVEAVRELKKLIDTTPPKFFKKKRKQLEKTLQHA